MPRDRPGNPGQVPEPLLGEDLTALLLFIDPSVVLGLAQGTGEPQEGSPAEGALEKIEEATRLLENITRSWQGFRFAPGGVFTRNRKACGQAGSTAKRP